MCFANGSNSAGEGTGAWPQILEISGHVVLETSCLLLKQVEYVRIHGR